MNQHTLQFVVTQDGKEGKYCVKCHKDNLSLLYNPLEDPCSISDDEYLLKLKKRDSGRWGKR